MTGWAANAQQAHGCTGIDICHATLDWIDDEQTPFVSLIVPDEDAAQVTPSLLADVRRWVDETHPAADHSAVIEQERQPHRG